jgi:hypothetical protein
MSLFFFSANQCLGELSAAAVEETWSATSAECEHTNRGYLICDHKHDPARCHGQYRLIRILTAILCSFDNLNIATEKRIKNKSKLTLDNKFSFKDNDCHPAQDAKKKLNRRTVV